MLIVLFSLVLAVPRGSSSAPALMSVAGIYQIDITVEAAGCAGLPSGTNTRRAFGVVSHAPGGTHLVIESDRPGRASRNMAAQLGPDGTFVVRQADGAFRDGRFTDTGFAVTESLTADGCRASATWRATKQGDRNVVGPLLPDGGGSFLVTKAVTSDTCAAGTASPPVMTGTGASIARTPTGARFVLNDHGTRNLVGTMGADGRFDIPRDEATVMGKIHAVDTYSNGRFDDTGFLLTVTTDLDAHPDGKAGACRVVTEWRGTRLDDRRLARRVAARLDFNRRAAPRPDRRSPRAGPAASTPPRQPGTARRPRPRTWADQ